MAVTVFQQIKSSKCDLYELDGWSDKRFYCSSITVIMTLTHYSHGIKKKCGQGSASALPFVIHISGIIKLRAFSCGENGNKSPGNACFKDKYTLILFILYCSLEAKLFAWLNRCCHSDYTAS